MLNYKEVDLLLGEIPFLNSYIQQIRESDYHSFTLTLFNKDEKAFNVYFEIASENSHFCMTQKLRKKSEKTQRFTQFLKAKIIGARIIEVHQLNFDRAFYLKLLKGDEILYALFRFYSGPGANIIICDENFKILDLMFRRPKRNEITGSVLKIEERESEPEKKFLVRPYDQSMTFNEFIDRFYDQKERSESVESLKEKIERERDRELLELERKLKRAKESLESTKGYEDGKRIADLLSSNLYLVKKGMSEIMVDDYEREIKVRIALRADLSARENLERYYKNYQKEKTQNSLALEDVEKIKAELEEKRKYYENLLSSDDLKRLRTQVEDVKKRENVQRKYSGPSFMSNGYILIVGRNSKENDEILRHDARGNDLWLHVRDFSGGYVIIKSQKNKEIPFSVILDASHLALHYSKAKDEKSADLYYTYVKYLRRAKDSKTGLVIPTQEKNLFLRVEDERMEKILKQRID